MLLQLLTAHVERVRSTRMSSCKVREQDNNVIYLSRSLIIHDDMR